MIDIATWIGICGAATVLLANFATAAADGGPAKDEKRTDPRVEFMLQKPIALPKPRLERGEPLMKLLAKRQSGREYASTPLDLQTLGDLLWAAWGINRPESGKRTAPSARNFQDMLVYVVMAEGTYVYDALKHALVPQAAGDHRAATGKQDFVSIAPVNLVYVSDSAKLADTALENRVRYAGVHAGLIAQNALLYCTSEGLATVVRAWYDVEALSRALELPKGQNVILAQTVGWPAQAVR